MKKKSNFFRDYPTKATLEKDIQDLIKGYSYYEEFESKLLSV